jgi:hypothetical protein
LFTNVKIGLKVTNTLAYYGKELITAVKSFIVKTQKVQSVATLKGQYYGKTAIYEEDSNRYK